ncbi:FadR family transcriptional regulator (plasmid) [Agrobacterium salinitolerans]|uniref:FadR/GntR family transcriptional regulator n=1 Tax=Agrobacterium salinitolerans TaxID=1183413 RepID=UPI000DCFE39C|nr:FadR/GntR family transcriptional regulator [Agrobacterium salinitolerans]QXC52323.1 FadR family transcriptional regulator [Agrobacterium salinitolerans]
MTETLTNFRPLMDLSSHVLVQLESMLAQPSWSNGGRLPPEAELARQFGVSRPVLRKALAHMRESGRIISRRGSANFVQPKADLVSTAGAPAVLSIQTVFDMKRCLRFRHVIECAAAEDAATVGDRHAIAAIQAAFDRMLSLPAGQTVFEADFAFHLAIAQATANPYFAYTLGAMKDQIRLTIEFTRKLQDRPPDQVVPRVVSEHGAVLEAIKSGDAVQARAAMEHHMQQSVVRLLEDD